MYCKPMTNWLLEATALGPTVFTIPAERSFVTAIAEGLLPTPLEDPLALTRVTVILPHQRACPILRQAFLRLTNGNPLRLPYIHSLNDLDEEEVVLDDFFSSPLEELVDIPPPISPLRRRLLLTALIRSTNNPQYGRLSTEQAAQLAMELGRLLDQVQTAKLDVHGLNDLVPENYADHWQEILRFLDVVTEKWPEKLASEQASDPAEHRNQVFAARTAAWNKKDGLSGLVIAAGSTGTIPATADLLATIAAKKNGCIVLPGLDTRLDDDAWDSIEETHPQFSLKQLLAHIGIDRHDIKTWPDGKRSVEEPSPRQLLISHSMRPADATDIWQTLPSIDPAATENLHRIDCVSPREEAEVIALIMRESLEMPGQTCALVTPDRNLARYVAGFLKRWNIDVDDSAGQPLHTTQTGTFLRLVAQMVSENFAPVPTLATLKHPLADCGYDRAIFRDLVRCLDMKVLRGPRPQPGLKGLEAAVQAKGAEHTKKLADLIADLREKLRPLEESLSATMVPFHQVLKAHMQSAEALAPLDLWNGSHGQVVVLFIAELLQDADILGSIRPHDYPGIFSTLMSEKIVRPPYNIHHRLSILGSLEARLHHHDVMILGGLNEGTWPTGSDAGPWMSRPMRKDFGLALPERRIGQAAHDVTQFLHAPKVYLTRAMKVDGAPTVPSRWLHRLEQVLSAAETDSASILPYRTNALKFQAWVAAQNHPTTFTPVKPPAPTPPVYARPRQLSATHIETLRRDPYAVYARHILKLRKLERLDDDPDRRDYGNIIHLALQKFVETFPDNLPKEAEKELLEIGDTLFKNSVAKDSLLAFWKPRFRQIAKWFIEKEQSRRPNLVRSYAEIIGSTVINLRAGPFKLTARADRIDVDKNGQLVIIDYKTGAPPSKKEVAAGFSPQLPLEAMIAESNGFADVTSTTVANLLYWRLHGRRENGGGEETIAGDNPKVLAEQAREGLNDLIRRYDDPSEPYRHAPSPEHAPKYSDYEHLARVKEWTDIQGKKN